MKKLEALFALERQFDGVLDIDTATVCTVNGFAPGYLDKEKELIVGLQTNRPLKRGVNPFGGIRMVRQACEAYGYKLSNKVEEVKRPERADHSKLKLQGDRKVRDQQVLCGGMGGARPPIVN